MSKTQSMRDFSGGVVNQELLNRDDGRGVFLDALNVLSSPNGELRRRSGTHYLADLPYKAKLVPFRLPDGNDAILVFTQRGVGSDSQVGTVFGYNYTDAGLTRLYSITPGATPEMPAPASWVTTTNGDWKIAASDNVSLLPLVFLLPSVISFLRDPIYLAGCRIDTSSNPPVWFDIINDNTPLTLMSVNFHFVYFGTGEKYRYLYDPTIEYSDDGITWSPCATTFVKTGQQKKGKRGEKYVTQTDITVSQSAVSSEHKYWRIFFSASNAESGESLAVQMDDIKWQVIGGQSLFTANTNFGVDDIDSLQYGQSYDSTSPENAIYITSGTNKQPMKITYTNGVFAVQNYTPTDTPTLWQTNGFPGCVEVFQNRLCFAGFTDFPGRILMSAFGDFETFTPPSPIQSTSAIKADSLQLKSRIDYLWAGNHALYALSNEGVAMIDAAGGVVATDNIEFQLRNREPAAAILPTVKDDIMIYVSRNQQKILVTDFDFVVQRYRAIVMSLKYDNFLSAGIKALHYIPTKAGLVYGILNNGQGFAWLFNQPTENNALFPLAIDGEMNDILPIKFKDTTKLLMVATNNGQWAIINKDPQPEMALMDFMDTEEQKNYTTNFLMQNNYMDYTCSYDSAQQFEFFPAPSVYSAEETVEVLADGKYLGEKQLVEKDMHQFKAAGGTTEYYVAQIIDGAAVWGRNTETGLWNFYNTLGVVEGHDWTAATQTLGDTRDWRAIAFGNSKFVSIGSFGSISTSTDGVTWTTPTQTISGVNTWAAMAYDGTKFVALSANGEISTSTDGTTWTSPVQNADLGLNFWTGLAWDGTQFVAIGDRGYVSTSADGTTWSTAAYDSDLGNNFWGSLIYDGTQFIALSDYGLISTSSDGSTWTTPEQKLPAISGADTWQGLAYGDHRYIAVSYSGNASMSVDADTWSELESVEALGAKYWYALGCGNDTFVAISGTGYVSTFVAPQYTINSMPVYDQFTTMSAVCCELDVPAGQINFGIPYQSYAVIKFATPYLVRKFPREIALNFINTAYLEMGNNFNDLRPVLDNLVETVTLDNRPILLNGNYEKTLDKQAFETPYVIVNSGKGLPFVITGMDYEIDYSNYQGGV